MSRAVGPWVAVRTIAKLLLVGAPLACTFGSVGGASNTEGTELGNTTKVSDPDTGGLDTGETAGPSTGGSNATSSTGTAITTVTTTGAATDEGSGSSEADTGAESTTDDGGGACPRGCLPELRCVAGSCQGEIALPLQDAYVTGEDTSGNYGAASSLLVDDFPTRRTLIQPTDLAGIPSDATVSAATLQLRCFDGGGTVHVRRLVEAWSAATVTFDDAPADDGVDVAVFDPSVGSVAIDIQSLAQSWVDGTVEMHGVRLISFDIDGSDYRSLEYSTVAERPSLVLEVSY